MEARPNDIEEVNRLLEADRQKTAERIWLKRRQQSEAQRRTEVLAGIEGVRREMEGK